ncbi:hypothetical protein HPSNT_02015 [Helicobacter pylori SNT49]|uniref:Uncharacterized protein n=1 Tax=Helicobacter pylori SNT49 TaxID=1055530 RepID=G2MBK7_HELPX|nr:hypothetical protein HPSNT_02015 [Helicobacter pylori SNT49]
MIQRPQHSKGLLSFNALFGCFYAFLIVVYHNQ